MEIFLDKRAVKQIRQSATDAIDDGDTETLREDVMDAFREEQIEAIESSIDSGAMYYFIRDAMEEWRGASSRLLPLRGVLRASRLFATKIVRPRPKPIFPATAQPSLPTTRRRPCLPLPGRP